VLVGPLVGLLLAAGAGQAATAGAERLLAAPTGDRPAIPPVLAQSAPARSSSPSPPAWQPIIEQIEVRGNTRTPAGDAIVVAELREGGPASAHLIQAAAERLRQSHLFQEVSVHTRPGSAPGHLIVVFDVSESRPSLRLGVGYEDLSGWYLIPVQLNLDNLSGHGEHFDLSARFGFRLQGLVLTHRRPSLTDPRCFWELALRAESQNRIYFHRDAEISHRVGASGIDLALGRPVTRHVALTAWASYEKLEPDSSAEVYQAQDAEDLESGDNLAFAELPPGVQASLAARTQGRFGLALGLDTRESTGVRRRGVWGHLLGEAIVGEAGDFQRAEWDLRAYAPLLERGGLAVRTRLGAVSQAAPFFQRYYLGGLYTVRGFPNQSLSPADGSLQFAVASAELRAAWIGPPDDPLLTGIVFLDYGLGWNHGRPDLAAGAASVGYGFRLRVPWIGRFGLDIGRPVTPSPVDEAFHINGSIGWSF